MYLPRYVTIISKQRFNFIWNLPANNNKKKILVVLIDIKQQQ